MNYDDPFLDLGAAIVKRAYEDLLLLKKYNVDRLYHKGCAISRSEIMKFFNSEWCKLLAGNKYNYIIERIKNENL